MELNDEAVRVLGCLIEKQLATPQQYPLSRNALVAACNQTTGRDPVVSYDEDDVRAGIDGLREHDLVKAVYATGSRTPKFAHLLDQVLEVDDAAMAVLAVLLLRGPQTPGELRTRTERLHAFASPAEVEQVLGDLAAHPYGALVAQHERRPGQKERRWSHLLGGAGGGSTVDGAAGLPERPPADAALGDAVPVPSVREEVDALRAEVAALRAEVAALRAALAGEEAAEAARPGQ